MIRMRFWHYDGDVYRLTTAYKLGKSWVMSVSWTGSCSGCFEGGDYMGNAHHYPYDHKVRCHIGSGCEECGYTGKRRNEFWVPIFDKDAQIVLNIRYRIRKMRREQHGETTSRNSAARTRLQRVRVERSSLCASAP